MKISKWIFVVVIVLIVMTAFPGGANPINPAKKGPQGNLPGAAGRITTGPSQTSRYVSIRLKQSLETLVAGQNGSFELVASLVGPEKANGHQLQWDPNAQAPVVVWIATPVKSGIAFIDKLHPEKPVHHFLAKFSRPSNNFFQPLTTKVNYTIDPKTKTGKHELWMDILSDLTGPEGQKIQDMGIATVPFKVDTHLWTKLLMLLVVAVAVFLFIVEWVRVDVVAIVMMVMLPELNLLNAQDTFKGLSSNAVVAIIGVMIISYGLNRAGLVSRLIHPMLKMIGKSTRRLTIVFSSLIALISSIMQNTGAAVLFLPGIRLATSYRLKVPISRVLMPIGMAAILGGTITMIGTSPLILLNDILPPGMPRFGFLELAPIGLAITVGGIAFLSTVGMRMLAKLPASQEDVCDTGHSSSLLDVYPQITGPYEIEVPKNYQAGNKAQKLIDIRKKFLVNIVAAVKADSKCEIAPLPDISIRPGFVLCAYGPEDAIRQFIQDYGLILKEEPECFKNNLFNPSLAGIVEAVVAPRSHLVGQTIKEIRFRETFRINALALHQAGNTYYRELADRPLLPGDTVLIHGAWAQLHALQDLHQNLIIITPYEKEFHKPEKAKWALTWFLISLFLMVLSSFYFQKQPYNPIPLSICLMLGAVGMVISRVITINEAYHAVDWRTVFLLAGLIPLGMAVDQTGTAEWIAKGIVTGLGSLMSPLLLLIILACLSCAFTMVISNVGACTLLVPLGISIAHQIGIDPRIAAIVVGLGVSNSFMLPTHQVNALYMGPGGYRSKDYFKIGGCLSIIYIAILVAMTYFFYL
ncbi:MAG: SLC13 family permease [Deltaproteobacteria bacterium]|nr:SLC13 family permease [Deltaproteobacteria bacterium]